jgi:hypothetical protein
MSGAVGEQFNMAYSTKALIPDGASAGAIPVPLAAPNRPVNVLPGATSVNTYQPFGDKRTN